MKTIREVIRHVIKGRVLPWIERDGISKLILPEQITPDVCAKPIKSKRLCETWHVEHEIGIGLTGEMTYVINGKRFLFVPGRILFITAGTPHGSELTEEQSVASINPNKPPVTLWFAIYPFGAGVALSRINTQQSVQEATPTFMLLDWHLFRLAESLLDEVSSKSDNYEGIARAILIEFMNRCLRASASENSPLSSPVRRWPRKPLLPAEQRHKPAAHKHLSDRVKKAQDFIHSNYNLPITRDEIVAAADSSISYLSKQFQTSLGMAPMQYLLTVRIKAARELLRTDLKVVDIARLVGIEDPYYFSRAFRRITGDSPLQYRQKMIIHPLAPPKK
jgi:AraC-like DNA-binding protein